MFILCCTTLRTQQGTIHIVVTVMTKYSPHLLTVNRIRTPSSATYSYFVTLLCVRVKLSDRVEFCTLPAFMEAHFLQECTLESLT